MAIAAGAVYAQRDNAHRVRRAQELVNTLKRLEIGKSDYAVTDPIVARFGNAPPPRSSSTPNSLSHGTGFAGIEMPFLDCPRRASVMSRLAFLASGTKAATTTASVKATRYQAQVGWARAIAKPMSADHNTIETATRGWMNMFTVILVPTLADSARALIVGRNELR